MLLVSRFKVVSERLTLSISAMCTAAPLLILQLTSETDVMGPSIQEMSRRRHYLPRRDTSKRRTSMSRERLAQPRKVRLGEHGASAWNA